MKNKSRLFLLLNILIPLISGALIYYYLSPDAYFVRFIDELTGAERKIKYCCGSFARLLRNYAPDMLWAYALFFCVIAIIGVNNMGIWISLILSLLFSVFTEFLQITGFIQGTFDLFDIIAELFAELTAAFIIKRYIKGERK